MNGIHDLGGMHGLGPIEREADEPAFHEPWEARMLGLRRAMTLAPGFTIDRFRFLRESMPPVAYLSWSYYEHWYYACARMLLEAGMVTLEELRTGHPQGDRPARNDAMRAAEVPTAFREGGRFSRPESAPARFPVGAAVIARNDHPATHTRLPRYARGKRGVVHRAHGAHVFPDSSAHGRGECPQHLYTVGFAARELWGGAAAPQDKVYLDLWESYLEPA
jgi:nitrile hydratase